MVLDFGWPYRFLGDFTTFLCLIFRYLAFMVSMPVFRLDIDIFLVGLRGFGGAAGELLDSCNAIFCIGGRLPSVFCVLDVFLLLFLFLFHDILYFGGGGEWTECTGTVVTLVHQ